MRREDAPNAVALQCLPGGGGHYRRDTSIYGLFVLNVTFGPTVELLHGSAVRVEPLISRNSVLRFTNAGGRFLHIALLCVSSVLKFYALLPDMVYLSTDHPEEGEMAIYLDSASVDDARRAAELGFVVGITTNPRLIARTGRTAEEVIPELCDALGEGLVFYQLTAPTAEEREAEAHRFAALRPGRVGLKIPCTTDNLALLHRLVGEGLTCAVTAIFSAHQALLACEAGADYVLPYVHRSTRLQGDGPALVAKMVAVTQATGGRTQVLAASFRSLSEVADAVLAGAHHVTVPLSLLLKMGNHPLSEQAIAEFAQAGGQLVA